jgi:DNA-3-methyladenine glycosylase
MILPLDYFQQKDVLKLGQDLLGKYLMTEIDGELTGGMIVEVEAYRGPEDRASHAWNNRRTKRTEVMYRIGGTWYVYCY